MEKQGGTSEEDLEEIDEEMEMEVKEEEGTVGEEGGFFTQEAAGGVQIQIQSVGGMLMGMGMWPMRRCRPKEERTKLRERHRRAIKARILAGLQRHGKYNPRVRADINDVIAALAREEGWVVLPDGTTFPSSSQVYRAPSIEVSGYPLLWDKQRNFFPLQGLMFKGSFITEGADINL